jgi:branched-chain amino acid transport system permease protein
MTALDNRSAPTEAAGAGVGARVLALGRSYGDVAVWAILIAAPYWLPLVGGYTELGARILILGLGAMALNFLLGFTGVLSFGHAAYFGLGAYGAGLTLKYLLPSTPAALAAGIVVGTLAGALLGALIVRLRGVYFAMVTIAFGQVFYYIAFRWSSVTGGDDGLRGFARQPIDIGPWHVNIASDHPVVFYYFALVVFAASVGGMAGLLRSPFGHTLLAIRENERRARFLGLPVAQHIWLSFVVSCFFMSTAGALNAFLDNFANPRDLHWQFSGNFVIMAVLGGMRSIWGPLLGAAFFVALQDYLSSMTQNWMSLIGVLFVLVVLFFPRGILGFIRRRIAT